MRDAKMWLLLSIAAVSRNHPTLSPLARSLSPEQRADIVAYYQSLRTQSGSATADAKGHNRAAWFVDPTLEAATT